MTCATSGQFVLMLKGKIRTLIHTLAILILETLTKCSSLTLGVPSSMKHKSVKYIPRKGIQGGSHLQNTRDQSYKPLLGHIHKVTNV